MPLLTFEKFSHFSFGKAERLLGCDVGTKTIGLALSDTTLKIATAFQVIHRSQWKKDFQTLLKIILTHHIGGIVVGFPLNMDGSEGPRCQSMR